MGKDKGGKPSRPYRGGHTGRGGSHEKGGCLAVIVGALVLGGGVAAGVVEGLRAVL